MAILYQGLRYLDVNNGCIALFQQPITPTFWVRSIIPTPHNSDNPLFRQPITPTTNNLAQQRIFFMTSGPGKQTTIDKIN